MGHRRYKCQRVGAYLCTRDPRLPRCKIADCAFALAETVCYRQRHLHRVPR